MMEKRLPGVSLPVSPVSLGTAQFGDSLGEKEACELLDVYTDRGGNLLDTANCYGRWLPHGENVSEQILGRWLRQHGNRNGLVISTKGGHPPFDAMTASRLHEKELRYDLESSLRSLGTDHVDLYWLHRDDPTLPVEELLGLLEQFRREGKLLSYGVSNWTTERVREAAKAAAAHGYDGFCGVQNQWSLARADHEKLADRTLVCMDQPLYDLLKEHPNTLCTMAFSAMGKGYFTKAAAGTLRDGTLREYRCALNDRRLAALRQLSEARGVSIAALVLAWMAGKPFPAVPIAAVSGMRQLLELTEALDCSLSADEVALLDAGEEY